jgi:hypothetical protein
MFYVTNFKLDKNNNFYPNYYIDDNDKSNIKYYDIDLNLIKEKDYNNFGLNKQEGGGKKLTPSQKKQKDDEKIAAKKQKDDEKAAEKARKEADKAAVKAKKEADKIAEKLKKEKEEADTEIIMLKEELSDVVKVQASQWIVIKDLLLRTCYQDFSLYNSKLKGEAYNDAHNDKKNKYRTNISDILKTPNLVIKGRNNLYYSFSSSLPQKCREEIAEQIIVDTKEFFVRKALYAELKAAFCINYFCITNAKFEDKKAPLKQRQECSRCKDHAVNPEKTGRQTGWLFNFTENLKGDIKVIDITAIPKYVINSYTNMCYNNYSKEYWGETKERLDEVKRRDVFINEENEELKDEYIFKYMHPTLRTLQPILINNKKYLCELRRPWNTYGNGLIELDHKDGKHNNNTVKNIQPLCRICHAIKTDQQQDKSSIIKDVEKKENAADDNELTFQATIDRYAARFKTVERAENFIAILNKNVFNEIKNRYFLLNANNKLEEYYEKINEIWNNITEPVPLLSEKEYNKLIGDEVIIRDKQLALQVKDEDEIGIKNDYKKLENEINPSNEQNKLLDIQISIQKSINENEDISMDAAFSQFDAENEEDEEDEGDEGDEGDEDDEDARKAKEHNEARDIALANYDNRIKEKETLLSKPKNTKAVLRQLLKDAGLPDPPDHFSRESLVNRLVNAKYPRIKDPYPELENNVDKKAAYIWDKYEE